MLKIRAGLKPLKDPRKSFANTACFAPLLFAAACMHPQAQQETFTYRSHVEHMAGETQPARPIEGTEAMLKTAGWGAAMTMQTAELPPGHVVTAWWVVITKPEACSATPCSPGDVIGEAEKVGTQITYADGVVVDPDGKADFRSILPAGPVTQGWYPAPFDNPTSAEIHLVLNDHGPLLTELAPSMLTSYRGGCSDESLPPPFPASAKSDGTPGPNGCRLIQDAIFVQNAAGAS